MSLTEFFSKNSPVKIENFQNSLRILLEFCGGFFLQVVTHYVQFKKKVITAIEFQNSLYLLIGCCD